MVTILPALRQVREDLAELLDRKVVKQVCQELEYTWRDRQLDPYTTLHLFILQVLNQNTAMTVAAATRTCRGSVSAPRPIVRRGNACLWN